ncbi:protocadherin Fat [Pimephales promelas]|nr:protocadherin Fat [Pimephales promelas]
MTDGCWAEFRERGRVCRGRDSVIRIGEGKINLIPQGVRCLNYSPEHGLRVHVETVRMAFTDTAIILTVMAVLGMLTRGQGSLVKDNSLLRFTHHLYNASIYENSAPRTYVESPVRMGIIQSDTFWDIKYKVVSGDDDGLFKAEQETVGDFCFLRIKTRSSNSAVLNREVRDIYTLTVEATESSYENRARTKVLIQVLDTNDLKPLFYPASYNVLIKEDTPIKSSLVRVTATDADIGSNADFYYSFTTRSHPFAVDPFTGTVTLVKRLDASQRDRYELTVLAEDRTKKISGVQKFGNVATVVVTVEKVTENFTLIAPTSAVSPQTDDDKISVNIKMEPKEKEKVASLSIVEGDPLKCFQIIPSTLPDGGFQLVSTKWIDWSQNPFGLNISLQAKDRSSRNGLLQTPIQTVHFHPPTHVKPLTFEQELYHVSLSEFSPPKSHVVKVSVGLSVKNTTFSIKENPDSYKFKISAKTGVIVTSQSLDFEKHSHYEFDVTANDGEAVTRVVVDIIDENDNAPRFTLPSYQASLPENVPIGTSILAVSAIDVDKDNNGFVTYAIANTSPVPFTIDPLTGVISTSQEFDYELMKRWYHLRIWASDSGSPFNRVSECSATITMTNINDNTPVFERVACNASIPRHFPVGQSITEMSALDLDELQQIKYRIESGNDEGLFAIDPVSGTIKLSRAIPANYEDTDNHFYILKITATDGKYSADPNTMTIHITGKGESATTYCEETGITRQLTEKLIESFKPSLTVKEDESISDVHIINQHSPKFIMGTPSSFDIREDFALNRSVLQFNATDNDSGFNGKLVYAISSGNEDGCFTIDMNTGDLKVISALDREQKEFYILNITVYDLGSPQISTWKFLAVNILDANDNPPLFSQPRYVVNIPENTEVDKSIFKANAVDFDLDDNGGFKFSLLTFTNLFQIDEVTGVVKVTGPLDRETFSRYDLKIEARDQAKLDEQLFSFVDLVVVLEDINDNPPKFAPTIYRIKVPEDVPPGTVLLWVESFDFDLESGGLISYNLKNSEAGTFFLDASTGCLTLESELDFERQQSYNLTVRAVDHGKPRSLSSSYFESLNNYVLTVLVSDDGEPSLSAAGTLYVQVQNRSHPIFQSMYYPLKLPENITPFTTILHVQARNPEGYGLIYNLEEDNASRFFNIDFKTGVLSVTDFLDFETQTKHILTVRATDSVTGTFSEAKVEIEVEDINDNAPVFQNLSYITDVSEGLPIGTSILQVSAVDRDSHSNSEVTYQLIDKSDFFDIDPITGILVTVQVLDYETMQQLTLKVKATDKGSPPLSGEAHIIVNVIDVNDNPPDFDEPSYRASLDEMATCGHIVIKVQASDPDSKDDLQYKILSGNEGRYFSINESSGLISFSNLCKKNLDPFYNLTVAVSDGVFQKTAPVNIDMTNGNKHSPYFNQNIYEADLAENAEVGTRVIRLAAIDPDDGPYGSVDYTIINKLADEKFSIDEDGQIVTSQSLDRENPSQRVIAIKVMAKDGGGRVGFCTVKIILTDENDNVPQFKASEYQVSIQSTVNKGSPVIQIMAYDADEGKNADVTYTVEEAEEVTEDIIELNPFTGMVSVKESLVGLENKIFTFKVKARDGGIPFYNSSVPVQVKVVPPEVILPRFTEPLYTFSASEDLPIGYEIGTVKADADMPLIYSLVDGNTIDSNKEHAFAVDKDSGTVVVQKNIDHEKTKIYKIDVIAQGNHNGTNVASLVSVHIKVQDVNDNQPMFEADPYKAFLTENLPRGTTIIQVTANDADTNVNGEVSYTIESEADDTGDMFTIDSQTGWITALKEADSETKQLHRFYVVATDHGDTVKLTSSVLVEVTITDENDNPPQFTEELYQGSILENSRPGTTIVTLTTADKDVSADNRQIVCYITEGDPLGQFSVTSAGEEWTVISKSPLDREDKDKYTLKITATDGRFQTSAKVEVHVLDLNDNSPLCEQLLYTEAVVENSQSGMFILKISASDPDIGTNGQVSFTLHGPNADKFHLDSKTGELYTLAALDRERESEYDLVVKATDGGGRSCQADVTLMVKDTNDNPPQFSTSHYDITVFDNTTIRTPIAVIYAKDPDTGINSEVRYSLQGVDSGFFSLDEISGILRLERSLADEPKFTYEMKVKATDRGLPRHLFSFATITVHVVILSDYKPLFLSSEYFVQIPESLRIGSEVISVSALPIDGTDNEPVRYTILSGNVDGRFQINSMTGLLSVNAPLDFELCREYYLSVEGARGKPLLSEIASVIINITDVNDNPPVFNNSSYRTVIAEDISPGDMVLQVSAVDLDGPPNNFIIYSIVNGDAKQQFSIDPRTGHVTVLSMLDREEITHYSLTVQAADEGDPPLSSAVQVTVTVSDVNDNPPTFSQINHSLVLQEGDSVGRGILQLLVTDRDTPQNGPPFSFHIVSGNEDRSFHIDQGGLLSVSSPLRRRGKPQHLLKIQVTDSGHPPLSSICVVKINITEQSRYPPTVSPLEVFITTAGGTFSKRVIGKLHATDQDPQDILSYKLVSEAPDQGLFSVDTVDGKIVVEKDLEPGLYHLNVSVSDGTFSIWAGVKVHVWAGAQHALDQGFTLQLAGLSAEEFVSDHWRGLQRSLGSGLNIPRQELHIASLQQQPNSVNMEVLLVRRAPNGSVQPVSFQHLTGVLSNVEDALGLNVLRLKHGDCVGAGCPLPGCRNAVVMRQGRMNTYATARANFITPQHSWESVCSCNESAVRFDGKGYLKYLYQIKEGNENFHLSLRLKTSATEGTVMTTNASDWGTLELVEKELWFRYGCGDMASASMQVDNHPVADGRWHDVSLEVNGTTLRLTIDAIHSKSVDLPQPCKLTQYGGALVLAGSNPSTDAERLGFTGCLESLRFNGEVVRGKEGVTGTGLQTGTLFGIYQCCSDVKICASNPCENGGTCVEDSSEGFRCICPLLYNGSLCENSKLPDNPCASQPCGNGSCMPNNRGYICNCSTKIAENRCQIACSPNPCLYGFACSMAGNSIHCERTTSPPYVEIAEICAGILGLVLLVVAFVCFRKRHISKKKRKSGCVQDSNGYFPTLPKSTMKETEISSPMENNALIGSGCDPDSPFRSLKPREQRELGPQVGPRSHRPQGPVICSVAPNLPPPPSTSSDNDSIRKNNWEHDYEVYPADPDYYGRPSVQAFPQFDIVESTYSSTSTESRRNSRFGGFPFPLDRADRRAPLPPCYSNQNLDDFLGPDGLPLPSSQCPNEYTAISYYPTQHARSLDNVSSSHKRLSVRLSVAQPSYADSGGFTRRTARSYTGSDMVESDYGSCEEVMF